MLRRLSLGLAMALALLVAAALALVYWPAPAPPPDRAPEYAGISFAEAEARAAELVAQMTLDEKLAQLHGSIGGALPLARWGLRALLRPGRDAVSVPANERLGVPALTFTDGPRGVAFAPEATAFPVAIARAASFDPALERAVASAIGVECRRGGYNYIASPCVNVLRHPGWGRAQESYGEDPLVNAAMGAAHVGGVQAHGVMACPKHYALNSIENNRLTVDVAADDRTLHEVYLPQFRACVDAGAASLMSAYNRVRGTYAGESRYLLEDILRGEWGFRGFVTSDWVFGVHDGVAGARAGLDVEMPWNRAYGDLAEAVAAGELPEARLDTLARRVVAGKLYWTSRPGQPGVDYAGPLSTPDHRALARRAAAESMVLLKNEGGLLPLDLRPGRRVLLCGALADAPIMGDEGSSVVAVGGYSTVLVGLREALGQEVALDYAAAPTAEQAAGYDAVVAVVGYAANDEGENIQVFTERDPDAPTWGTGGDRTDLRLKRPDVALLRALGGAGVPVAAVLIGGSAITVDEWIDEVDAVLLAWYPGERGGEAVADVLLGRAGPGGRLPVTVPREGQALPAFDPFGESATYGYTHGYTHHRATAQPPRFPFGYGLGYGEVALDTAYVTTPTDVSDGDTIRLVAELSNRGAREDVGVPQAYVTWPAAAERPAGMLRAFAKTRLAPGERAVVELAVPTPGLRNYAGGGAWTLVPGTYTVHVGTDAEAALRGPGMRVEVVE